MAPPLRPQSPTGQPGLDWLVTDDGSRTLWSQDSAETFHSGCGAVAESLVVYVLNSGVGERLQRQLTTRVLEVGLGTGTDFLLAAALAEHNQCPFVYTALESELLDPGILRLLHDECLWKSAANYCVEHELLELAAAFDAPNRLLNKFYSAMQTALDARARQEGEDEQLTNHQIGRYAELRIIHGDATRFDASSHEMVEWHDAVFFDPFSPESAPDMWTDAMFLRVASALRVGGSLTTYCVKGSVRRQLSSLGFRVSKCSGPTGGKREVLHATKLPASTY